MKRFFVRVELTIGEAMSIALGVLLALYASGCVMGSDPVAHRNPPGVVAADGGGSVEDAAIVEDGGNVEDAAIVEDGGGNVEDAAIVEDGGNVEDAAIVEDGGNVEDGCQVEGDPCARVEAQPNGDGTITLCVTCLGEPSIVHCGSTGSGPWACDATLACRSSSVGWDACAP